jgi:putative ABC transport system permease protein
MTLLGTLRVALKALSVNKLRSALTMLGIVIGVAAVITMIAIGAGAQERVAEQIRSLGSNIMLILPGSRTAGGVRLGSSSQQTLTEEDALAIARDVAEVQSAAPLLRSGVQVVYGNTNWATGGFGVSNDYFEVRDWALISGRLFEPGELSASGKVVILGQTVARQLFGDEDPLDRTIRVGKLPVVVIGVLQSKGQNSLGQDQDDLVAVPISTLRNRIQGQSAGRLKRVGSISVKVRDGMSMAAAEDAIRALLRQRHRLQSGQEDDFSIRNLTEILQTQEASSRILTWLLAAVAGVSLLVGGIGIMNIMLVSVTERTREIGLRMAVGARGRDILAQFMVEATTLSLIGGLIGVALGVFAAVVIGDLAGWRTRVSPSAIVLAVSFAAAIGIFFGFYPARKAARLQPIEALRYE